MQKVAGTLEYGSVATLFSDESMTRKAHSTILRQFTTANEPAVVRDHTFVDTDDNSKPDRLDLGGTYSAPRMKEGRTRVGGNVHQYLLGRNTRRRES